MPAKASYLAGKLLHGIGSDPVPGAVNDKGLVDFIGHVGGISFLRWHMPPILCEIFKVRCSNGGELIRKFSIGAAITAA